MQSLWDIANPQLQALAVYQPGKPIEETARELGCDPAEIIKLASNENPLGPSPLAVAAMREALERAQLYPDGGGYYLREKLAEKLSVDRNNIILGNGSNEIIEFLGHALLQPGDEVVTSQHAFVAYKIIAALFGARTVEAPDRNFAQDVGALLGAITARTKIVFVANPNNPTGTLLSSDQIDDLLARVPPRVVVCLDEAYYEFLSDPPDTLRHVREHRRVIVLRTFSKIAGLASLRVGYGIAPSELIEILHKTREPFNVNGIGQIGARAALDDVAHYAETKHVTDEGRAYLQDEFARLGLTFVPAAANFILVNVGDGPAVFRALLERHVIVRAMGGYQLPEWVRISVGTMEENRRCIAALSDVLKTRL